jgi:hypothetical protein
MKVSKLYLIIMSIFAFSSVANCAPFDHGADVVIDNNLYYYGGFNFGANRDSNFRQGVKDGCESARGNWRKNIFMYNHILSYRDGWKTGYDRCRHHNNNYDYDRRAYLKGYDDGCWSRRHYRTRKNFYEYDHSRSYRDGWKNGYHECR